MQERLICFALSFWCWCRCYKCLNMNFFFWSRKNNHLPAKNKLQSAVKIIMIMIIWIGCIHTYSCQDRHRAKIREVFSSPYKKISTQICTVKKQGIGLCSDRPRSFFWNVNNHSCVLRIVEWYENLESKIQLHCIIWVYLRTGYIYNIEVFYFSSQYNFKAFQVFVLWLRMKIIPSHKKEILLER